MSSATAPQPTPWGQRLSPGPRRASAGLPPCGSPKTVGLWSCTAATPSAAATSWRRSRRRVGAAASSGPTCPDMADVRRLAEESGEVDVLVNNAGTFLVRPDGGPRRDRVRVPFRRQRPLGLLPGRRPGPRHGATRPRQHHQHGQHGRHDRTGWRCRLRSHQGGDGLIGPLLGRRVQPAGGSGQRGARPVRCSAERVLASPRSWASQRSSARAAQRRRDRRRHLRSSPPTGPATSRLRHRSARGPAGATAVRSPSEPAADRILGLLRPNVSPILGPVRAAHLKHLRSAE